MSIAQRRCLLNRALRAAFHRIQRALLTLPDGKVLHFAIGDRQREALLKGWDEIARILHDEGANISAFEHRQREAQPWLYAAEPLPLS